jgi:hypothetical protein
VTGETLVLELSTEQRFAWIEKIFTRLLAIYGDRFAMMWAPSDKDEMKEVWGDALRTFNANEIQSALHACMEREYPPNLPQFVALCRASVREETRPSDKRLCFISSPPVSKEKAQETLRELMVRFRRARNEQEPT